MVRAWLDEGKRGHLYQGAVLGVCFLLSSCRHDLETRIVNSISDWTFSHSTNDWFVSTQVRGNLAALSRISGSQLRGPQMACAIVTEGPRWTRLYVHWMQDVPAVIGCRLSSPSSTNGITVLFDSDELHNVLVKSRKFILYSTALAWESGKAPDILRKSDSLVELIEKGGEASVPCRIERARHE